MLDLSAALDYLDDTREAFIARVDALTDDQRAFRPAPDAWSPVEIAEHLWRTEKGFAWVLDRQIQAGDGRRDLGPRDPDGMARLTRAMRSGERMKMPPQSARHIAPQGLPWAEVRAGWRATADEWRRVAATVPDALAAVGLFGHPIAGPMTAAEGARFAALHAEHHGRQFDRVEADAAYPSA